MTVVQIMQMQQKTAKKLMAAIAMLLVAAILMGVTTYAWITISTAPEVRGINTTVGGNGYLEIALQSPASGSTLSRAAITNGRGDSGLNAKVKNTKWGNVIQLNTEYGLESVTIYPSRLNVSSANQSVNTNGYLSIPEYGDDGRIKQMNGASFLTYTSGNTNQFTEGRTYGVNILGTPINSIDEDQTITYHYRRSMIRDEAAGYLEEYRTDLRNQMISLLENQSVGFFNLLISATDIFVNQRTDAFTDSDISTAKTIIDKMLTIVRNSEVSLKWALLAEAIADDNTYPSNNETSMEALGSLYQNFLTYPLTSDPDKISIRSIAENNGYDDIVNAVSSIDNAEIRLIEAKAYINSDDTMNQLLAFMRIIDVPNTLLKNGTESQPEGPGTGVPTTGTARGFADKDYGLTYNAFAGVTEDYLYFINGSDGVSNGLFSIMASVLGDYQTTEIAYLDWGDFLYYPSNNSNNTREQYTYYIRGTGKTAVGDFNEENNRGVLGSVYDKILTYNPGNAMISFLTKKTNGSAYGYSIDFAFRTNENCKLLLSQEALNRVSGMTEDEAQDNDSNSNLIGGGSTASFTLSGDLIGNYSNNAKKLIQNIYIVLTDTDSGGILGIVAADETEVVLEKGNATLAIFEPNISEDGILSKGAKRDSNIITSMTKNQPVYITAIVFLNGDTLPAGVLAATQHPSLYGTINLQFASSVTLTPMSYSGYNGG